MYNKFENIGLIKKYFFGKREKQENRDNFMFGWVKRFLKQIERFVYSSIYEVLLYIFIMFIYVGVSVVMIFNCFSLNCDIGKVDFFRLFFL